MVIGSSMDHAGIQLETLSTPRNTNNVNQRAANEPTLQDRVTVASPIALIPIQPTISHPGPCPESPESVNPRSAREALHDHPSSTSRSRSQLARLRSCLSPARSKAFIGATIALVSLIVTIIALLPSFSSRLYDKGALELAIWTAKKDYMEACQQVLNPLCPT